MNWLRRFMYGRYGLDTLSKFLFVLSFILYICNFSKSNTFN